tara:strand:+ start:2026 stop:3114 length:1089 start_codon:yes stop_codon:yes gene_type:complete
MKSENWTIKLYKSSEYEGYLPIENLRKHFVSKKNIERKRSISADYYKWKFDENHVKKGILLVSSYKEEIIGMISVTYREILFNGDKLIAGELGDGFIRTEYNRKGMFRSLLKESKNIALKDNCNFIYGTPNQLALPGELKAGYRIVPDLEIKNLVLPLNIDSILRKRFNLPFIGHIIKFFFIFFNFLKSFFYKDMHSSEIHIKNISEFPDEIETLFDRCRSDYDWIVKRDKSYLDWRFLKNPDHYSNYLIFENKRVVGYFVMKICNQRGLKIGYIADYLIEKRCIKYEVELKSNFIKLFKDQEVELVSIWINKKNFLYKTFKKIGFIYYKNIPVIVYKNQLKNINKKRDFIWHFTLADSDNI